MSIAAIVPPAAETGSQEGVFPSQWLRRAIAESEIAGAQPIAEDQIQPASLDLRLGARAYRVRASFLPGPVSSVAAKLEGLSHYEVDLSEGAVLERGCVYIVPLLESLRLPPGVAAVANPKSSIGRLDLFTRLIADRASEFDRVPAGYSGPLYLEISPRAFSVVVRTGSRLAQLRLLREGPRTALRSLPITVDLETASDGVIGYRVRPHAGIIDVDKKNFYAPLDFWEPIARRAHEGLILNPDEFYILASKEAIAVAPDEAAELVAYDTLVGEFRVHYAGFFDPGFGHGEAAGTRAVLEVRSHDVPFLIEDGQLVGRLVYEQLIARPDKLYGTGIGSSYQRQGLKLGRQFRQA